MAGYYCPNGTLEPCPAGTYGNRSGLSSVDMCTDCPSGAFCQVMLNLSKVLRSIDCPRFTHSSLWLPEAISVIGLWKFSQNSMLVPLTEMYL